MPHVIVWDVETIPDISEFAAANDLFDKSSDEVREIIGDKFPKHIRTSKPSRMARRIGALPWIIRSHMSAYVVGPFLAARPRFRGGVMLSGE